MKKTEITTSYGQKRIRVYTENTEPDKTDQSFKKETDVNAIMARAKKGHQITHLARTQGVYADVSTIQDLGSSLMAVQKAQEAFMTIPAELRKKLDNDPVNLIKYLQDSNNDEEAIKYGLKVKKTETPPDPIKPPTSNQTSE